MTASLASPTLHTLLPCATMPEGSLVGGGAAAARSKAVVGLLSLHLLLIWAVMQLDGVRYAAQQAAPLFVAVLNAASEPAPPESLPDLPKPQKTSLPAMAPVPVPPPVLLDAPAQPSMTVPVAIAPAAEPQSTAVQAAPVTRPVVAVTTPAPAPAPVAPKLLPSSGVQFLEPPVADYPKASRRNAESGVVVIRAYVDSTGGPPRSVQVEQSSGFIRLDQAALAAVQRARFRPYLFEGKPVEGWALIPIRFELEK